MIKITVLVLVAVLSVIQAKPIEKRSANPPRTPIFVKTVEADYDYEYQKDYDYEYKKNYDYDYQDIRDADRRYISKKPQNVEYVIERDISLDYDKQTDYKRNVKESIRNKRDIGRARQANIENYELRRKLQQWQLKLGSTRTEELYRWLAKEGFPKHKVKAWFEKNRYSKKALKDWLESHRAYKEKLYYWLVQQGYSKQQIRKWLSELEISVIIQSSPAHRFKRDIGRARQANIENYELRRKLQQWQLKLGSTRKEELYRWLAKEGFPKHKVKAWFEKNRYSKKALKDWLESHRAYKEKLYYWLVQKGYSEQQIRKWLSELEVQANIENYELRRKLQQWQLKLGSTRKEELYRWLAKEGFPKHKVKAWFEKNRYTKKALKDWLESHRAYIEKLSYWLAQQGYSKQEIRQWLSALEDSEIIKSSPAHRFKRDIVRTRETNIQIDYELIRIYKARLEEWLLRVGLTKEKLLQWLEQQGYPKHKLKRWFEKHAYSKHALRKWLESHRVKIEKLLRWLEQKGYSKREIRQWLSALEDSKIIKSSPAHRFKRDIVRTRETNIQIDYELIRIYKARLEEWLLRVGLTKEKLLQWLEQQGYPKHKLKRWFEKHAYSKHALRKWLESHRVKIEKLLRWLEQKGYSKREIRQWLSALEDSEIIKSSPAHRFKRDIGRARQANVENYELRRKLQQWQLKLGSTRTEELYRWLAKEGFPKHKVKAWFEKNRYSKKALKDWLESHRAYKEKLYYWLVQQGYSKQQIRKWLSELEISVIIQSSPAHRFKRDIVRTRETNIQIDYESARTFETKVKQWLETNEGNKEKLLQWLATNEYSEKKLKKWLKKRKDFKNL